MKKFAISFAALANIAGVAHAADLPIPARMSVKAAPVASYEWTGFYVGVHYGAAIGQSVAGSVVPSNTVIGIADVSNRGLLGGIQAGVNWQVAASWLIGLQGDIGYMGVDRSNKDWLDDVTMGMKTGWYGTFRGRTGYVTGPSLLYVTGGAAFVDVKDTFGGNVLTGLAPTISTRTQVGWTAGGGIETKLSRNWSTAIEYLYIDAGSQSFAANPYGVADTATLTHRFHVIKTALNYKFGDPEDGLPFLDGPLLGPGHDWAGLYVGVNAGVGTSDTHIVGTVDPVSPGADDINGTGFTGGVQAGYNVMLGPKWFAGIEGDFGFLGISRTYQDWGDLYTFAQKTSWYGTLRGRFGRNTGPALLYVTAGAAAVNTSNSITALNPDRVGGDTSTGFGWVIGGGTEVALDARWSAKLEALYMDVGRRTEIVMIAPTFLRGIEFQRRFEVVRVGLTYHFGGNDVVTTRY